MPTSRSPKEILRRYAPRDDNKILRGLPARRGLRVPLALKGDMMPYTSLNGHMLRVLTEDGMFALRLGVPDRAGFVTKYKTKPVVMYGATMQEYVNIPDALLARTAELKKYFDASYG